jgi:hypothetical protein
MFVTQHKHANALGAFLCSIKYYKKLIWVLKAAETRQCVFIAAVGQAWPSGQLTQLLCPLASCMSSNDIYDSLSFICVAFASLHVFRARNSRGGQIGNLH